MSDTVIGISIALVSGVISSFGFILQKKGYNIVDKHNNNLNGSDDKKLSVAKVPIWWIGLILSGIASILRAVSFNFAAQSIIAPLLAFNIAVNTVLAHFMLKEKIQKKDVLAIVVIIIGVAFIIIFGPSSSNQQSELTVSTLRYSFQRADYIVFISVLTCLAAVDYAFVRYFQHKNFKSDNNDEIVYGKNFLLLSWTFLSGYFRSNNDLFIKSSMALITSSFESKENMKENVSDYLSYIMFVLWIICFISAEYFRQRALSYFGAALVIPLYSGFAVIVSVFLGGIFFDEFDNMDSALNISLLFTLGAVIMLAYDVGKILDDLYSIWIKVAYIDGIECKEPKTACSGGVVSEYFCRYHLRNNTFFLNQEVAKS